MNSCHRTDGVTTLQVGKQVTVTGYSGSGLQGETAFGTLQFMGEHKKTKDAMCGVVFQTPIGNMDGKDKGHKYFKCAENHGVLVKWQAVQIKAAHGTFGTWEEVVKDAVTQTYARKVDPQKVSVFVSPSMIKIKNAGNDQLYSTKPNHIPYFGKFGSGKFLSYVCLDPTDGQLYCRILSGKSNGAMEGVHCSF
jgi:hypothetical protein